jgi:Ca2+-binding RTX toxin-like protein
MNRVTGSFGNDKIHIGSSGSTHARGLAGNDILYGNCGSDTLEGGKGYDIMVGRGGRDTYLWRAEDLQEWDIVVGFKPGDRVEIQGLLNEGASLESKLAHLSLGTVGRSSFRLDILNDQGESLQDINFTQSTFVFAAGSSEMKLRALLEDEVVVFS